MENKKEEELYIITESGFGGFGYDPSIQPVNENKEDDDDLKLL